MAAFLCGIGCKKDTGKLPLSFPANQNNNDLFICGKRDTDNAVIPPEPPSGFLFANKYGSQGVWRILYDLQNKDVIYYTTLQQSYANYLHRYNRRTGEHQILDKQVLNTLTINKAGWLAYEKTDKNIYKIKSKIDLDLFLFYARITNPRKRG